MDDRAFDLKLAAMAYNRDNRQADNVREALKVAVPFSWTAQALQASDSAAQVFPADAVLQPSDLIEPVQFWVYPSLIELNPPAGEYRYVTSAVALVDYHAQQEFLLIRFMRMRFSEGFEFPAVAWGGVSIPYGQPFHDRTMKCHVFGDNYPPDDTPEWHAMHGELAGLLYHAFASQFWLKSPAAVTTSQALSRGARRRAVRESVPFADIHVITLRHAEPSGSAADHAAREYSRRWLVSPHWRQQYLPSTGGHRPTYIEEHIKGPADKPLIAHSEKRYRVTK